MSIRVKLVLSNIAMIIIPTIFSMFLAFMIIGSYADKHSWNSIQGDEITKEDFRNILNEYSTIFYEANNYPEKFTDKNFLNNIEKNNLDECFFSGIAVKVDDELVYISEKYKNIDIEEVEKQIENNTFVSQKVHGDEKDTVNAFTYRLKFKDGKEGVLFLLFDAKPIRDFFESFFGEFIKGIGNFVKGVFFILVLTATGLTFIVSRNIIKPIRNLKYGAEQIKDGNLSFELNETSNDEIGKTCRAFEEMRQRLKESIDSQLKMDESRVEFIASISHDLKTPITSIKGYIEGIIDGVANSPEKLDKYAKNYL